jgi:LysR family transcriptional regulator for metE and metH
MTLEVRHLELVQTVAEAGGLSRATARLHLTESALSRQLAGLEESLGTRLFLRTGRRMLLTPAGEKLLQSSRGILESLRRTEDEVRRLSTNGAGLVRLATECYTCYHWLPSLLRDFSTRHPHVEVRVLADDTRNPVAALLEGRIDLAILSEPSAERRIQHAALFKDELVALLPPGHPLEDRAFLNAEDFAGANLILYVPPEKSTLIQEVLLPAGVSPGRITQIQLTEAIVEMVKSGMGVSVMARWAVAPQLLAGTLRAVRVTRRGLRRTWQAATLRTRQPVVHLDEFIRLLARGSAAAARRNSI